MGATLDALHRLQEVELQIAEIQQRVNRRKRAVTKQEKRIADLDKVILSKTESLRSDQIEADGLDLEVKSHEVNIAKLRQDLNIVKTNKEYSAVLTQLNTIKADVSKLEDRVLGIFNQLESKRKEIATLEEDRDKDAKKLEELQETAKRTEEKTRARLEQLTQERTQAAQAVPSTALDFFNRVAQKHDGEAMAQVQRTHPKRQEYACGGCNMSVTIEQVNAVLSRDEAIICNVCGCILYFETSAASGTR